VPVPPPPPGAVPPPAIGGLPGGGVVLVPTPKVISTTYDIDDVKVLDTKGKEIDKKDLPKLLKEESVAMASPWGQTVDPLHLRVLKDGALMFVLPAPKGMPGVPGGVAPGGPNILPFPVPPGPGGAGQ